MRSILSSKEEGRGFPRGLGCTTRSCSAWQTFFFLPSLVNSFVVYLLFEMAFFDTEQVPIDNWLLQEVKEDFNGGDDPRMNFTSIGIQVNLLVAGISGRFILRKEGDTKETIKRRILITFLLLEQILPLTEYLEQVSQELSRDEFIQALGFDNKTYIGFCNLLVETIEKRCKVGDFDFPCQFKEAKEVREWMSEALLDFGLAKINLIGGWKHPLAEIHSPSAKTNNLATCNTWMFASMLCGAATRRFVEGNVFNAVSILSDMGVIQNQSDSKLITAIKDDGAYLKILNETKEALDRKAEEIIEKQSNN